MNATKTKYTDAREFTQFVEPSPLDYTAALVLDLYLDGFDRQYIACVAQKGCYSNSVGLMRWRFAQASRTSSAPEGRCYNCANLGPNGIVGGGLWTVARCTKGINANINGIFHRCTEWESRDE